MLTKLTHWVVHKLGWETGVVTVFWRGRHLMVGFRCNGCGVVSGVHESDITRQRE